MNRDAGVTELIRAHLPEWSVPAFELVAMLGDELVVVGVLALLVGRDIYRSFEHGSDRLLAERTAFIVAVVFGGLALTLVLKTAFGAPRPPTSLQAVPRAGDGFPSGHTMAATVLWTTLALWGTQSTRRRRMVAASGAIALVAFSRLALGVHFVVDVVASVLFGVGFILLVAQLTRRDPRRAFLATAALGATALLATGGTTDGWLAFLGCTTSAVGWWVISRPTVRELWLSTTR